MTDENEAELRASEEVDDAPYEDAPDFDESPTAQSDNGVQDGGDL